MFRRSLPSHGGIETCGTSVPTAETAGVGEGVGSRLGSPLASPGSPDAPESPEAPGEDDASAVQTACESVPMKMQSLPRTSRASTSYRATTMWLAAITNRTASRPATDKGLRSPAGPIDPSPGSANVLRYSATRYASTI